MGLARRGARLAIALLLTSASSLGLFGCGSSPGQLTTTLVAAVNDGVAPGESPLYTIKVVNEGSNGVTGVTLHVDLPAEFAYKATTDIGGHGQSRIQLRDAAVNSHSPEWGLWGLPGPTTLADGTVIKGEIDLTFTVDAEGPPGIYAMTGRATSDATDGPVEAKPLPVIMAAAPHLSMVIAATPGNIHPTNSVTYRVTVTNDGSGAASDLSVLVTLPSAFIWTQTQGISGNSARQGAVDPLRNTSIVDYGGFTVPARSEGGPGVLIITFRVQCLAGTPAGSYPVSGQLTDSSGFVLNVRNTVPVIVLV